MDRRVDRRAAPRRRGRRRCRCRRAGPRVQQVAHEPVQARGEVRAAAVDADERDGPAGVLLDDLVRDAHERAAHVVLVEDDLWFRHPVPSWPRGTGLRDGVTVAVAPAAPRGSASATSGASSRSAVRRAVVPRPGRGSDVAEDSATASPQPATIHQPAGSPATNPRPDRGGEAAADHGAERPPRRASGRPGGWSRRRPPRRPACARRHAGDRGVGDRRVDHAEADAEHDVGGEQQRRAGCAASSPVSSSAADRRSPTPPSSSGSRGPRRPTRRPDSGAKTSVIAAIGSMYRPACSGESPRTSCR